MSRGLAPGSLTSIAFSGYFGFVEEEAPLGDRVGVVGQENLDGEVAAARHLCGKMRPRPEVPRTGASHRLGGCGCQSIPR